MTTGEPQTEHHEKPATTTNEGTPLKRIRDWFWCGPALAKARKDWPEPSERESAFAQRARASAELAENMLGSGEPSELRADGSACEMYRQASYWALAALLAQADPTFQPDDSERVWARLDDETIAKAATNEARIEALRSALRSGSFVYFAEQPAAEQTALLKELRALSRALLVKIAARSSTLDSIYLRRAWRLALLALVALCVALTPAAVKKVLESRAELSAGKAWRISSNNGGGCTSPAQQCAESPSFFFHTTEEPNPWVEFDLGAVQSVHKVRVENRTDCCADRADPLVIEISSDQKRWKKASRHEGMFTTWDAEFNPVRGRYVRVRLMKHGYLHLLGVHIY